MGYSLTKPPFWGDLSWGCYDLHSNTYIYNPLWDNIGYSYRYPLPLCSSQHLGRSRIVLGGPSRLSNECNEIKKAMPLKGGLYSINYVICVNIYIYIIYISNNIKNTYCNKSHFLAVFFHMIFHSFKGWIYPGIQPRLTPWIPGISGLTYDSLNTVEPLIQVQKNYLEGSFRVCLWLFYLNGKMFEKTKIRAALTPTFQILKLPGYSGPSELESCYISQRFFRTFGN